MIRDTDSDTSGEDNGYSAVSTANQDGDNTGQFYELISWYIYIYTVFKSNEWIYIGICHVMIDYNV